MIDIDKYLDEIENEDEPMMGESVEYKDKKVYIRTKGEGENYEYT
jgi:hypothetical protein